MAGVVGRPLRRMFFRGLAETSICARSSTLDQPRVIDVSSDVSSKTLHLRPAPRARKPPPPPASGLKSAPAAKAWTVPPHLAGGEVSCRIIKATVDAIIQRGVERFSMTEVSRAASVSRQTLYRYFPSKEALLEGLIDHLQRNLERALVQAMEADPTLDGRIKAVSVANLNVAETHKISMLLRAEPCFMLRFVDQHAESIFGLLQEAFAPFFDEAEGRSGATIDRSKVAMLILRIRISAFFERDSDRVAFARWATTSLIHSVLRDPENWAIEPCAARRGSQRQLENGGSARVQSEEGFSPPGRRARG